MFKERFRIFRSAPEYPIDTQVQIVYACVVIHNFLSKAGALEVGREHLEAEAVDGVEDIGETAMLRPARSAQGSREMDRIRERMTEAMWQSYLEMRGTDL